MCRTQACHANYGRGQLNVNYTTGCRSETMNLDIASAFCKSLLLRFVYSSIARASVPEALDYENGKLEMFSCSLLLVCKTTNSRKPSNMLNRRICFRNHQHQFGLYPFGISNKSD